MNKKFLTSLLGCGIFLLLALALWIFQPAPPQAEQPPEETFPQPDFELQGSAAFVYDLDAGKMLFVKGEATAHLPMASITKLFTAKVALQILDGDKIITAGNEVDLIHPDSSIAYILPGHRLSVKKLVQGLLLPSGNDAAYILAVAAGRELKNDPNLPISQAISAFVEEMNTRAAALGMKNTHFANPDGMDADGHYTCPEDLVILGKLALDDPTISAIAAQAKADVTYESGQNNTWVNSNLLLQKASAYYEPSATGLKTGSTQRAGNCLLSSFDTGERRLLIGVLGCPTDEDRYKDTLRLYTFYTEGRAMTFPGEQTQP